MTNLSGTNLNNGAAVGPQGEGKESPSNFPKYPAYKDSGDEWLGKVPEHWQALALSRVLAAPVTDGPHTTPEFLDDGVPFLSVDGIQDGKLYFEGCRYVSFEDHKEFSKKAAPKYNDLLMGKAASVGKIARVAENIEFSIWSPLALIRVNEGQCSPEFLEFCLKSSELQHQILLASNSNTQLNIGMKDIPKLRIPLPALQEQTQIARFLDHETARIDALIEEQQRLIELLKEKRQAVISHAVTRGLDPTVPMKDSGVEWLGEVPAHWVVRKLKNLVSVRGGSTPSKEVERYWEGDIPWVSPKDMKSERISNSIDHVSASAIEDGGLNMVKSGAILIVVRGMILIHSVPVAITDVEVTINQDMKAMTPGAELSGDYLSLLLQGVRDAVFQYIDSSAHGTRKLEWERFELIDLPIPSHAEQVSIVSFIEKQKRAIDDLVEQAASAITLMKERRSALISAAVTGKIDVCGWQPPASAPTPELVQEAV